MFQGKDKNMKNKFITDKSGRLLVALSYCGIPRLIALIDRLPLVAFKNGPLYIPVEVVAEWFRRELQTPELSPREIKKYQQCLERCNEVLASSEVTA
jgi:hypothetical protein